MRMALLSGSNINDDWTTTTTDYFRDYPYRPDDPHWTSFTDQLFYPNHFL